MLKKYRNFNHLLANEPISWKPVRASRIHPETQNASISKWTIYCDMSNCIKSHHGSKQGHSNVIHYVAHWLPPCIYCQTSSFWFWFNIFILPSIGYTSKGIVFGNTISYTPTWSHRLTALKIFQISETDYQNKNRNSNFKKHWLSLTLNFRVITFLKL